KPVSTTSTVLNQYQLNVPMVDVHTLGAGGGAIAWLDAGRNLRVGPRSAGARPGPACYGEGGTEPTVTDVDLLLGIINPDNFLGAAPMHCASYAADLEIAEVVVPLGPTAAVFSAYGLAASDIVLTAELSSPTKFPPPPEQFNGAFAQLRGELDTRLADQGLKF